MISSHKCVRKITHATYYVATSADCTRYSNDVWVKTFGNVFQNTSSAQRWKEVQLLEDFDYEK